MRRKSRDRRGRNARNRTPLSASDWLWLALLGAVCLVVAWQVVQTSAADALIRRAPLAAAAVAPRDPRVSIELAMLEYEETGGRVRPQARTAAVEALTRAPLADEPFFLQAMNAFSEGKQVEAERMLAEARHRNPRSRFARLLLLDRYLRAGKIEAATGEITALESLTPEVSNVLVAELARLARAPATRGALEQALQRHPAPRDGLLQYLAANGADPDLILRLARNVPAPAAPTDGPKAPPAWQPMLIASLIDRGEVGRAYQLWRSFAGDEPPARQTGLYDPNLKGLPGMAPFNWSFPETLAGAVERSRTGLQVEFYGRDGAELASQLLTLPPGRYRFSFIAEGSADGESSKLSWTLTCQESKASLGELVLKGVDYKPRRIVGLFTVPPSCPAQWLRLVGTPAEFVKPQNVTIRSISLVKAP